MVTSKVVPPPLREPPVPVPLLLLAQPGLRILAKMGSSPEVL